MDGACVIISQRSVRILQNKDAFLRITREFVCFKAGTRVCAVSREASQVGSFKARVMFVVNKPDVFVYFHLYSLEPIETSGTLGSV